jgi:Xaa-Pro aminopeptidase
MFATPPAEITRRLESLQAVLTARGLDGALISQNADLYYFAATIQTSQLYVPAHGEPLLMTRKNFARATAESPLPRVVQFSGVKDLPGLLGNHGLALPRRIGMELDVLPVNTYLALREMLNEPEMVDVSPDIRTIRSIKSDHEIGLLRGAAVIMSRMFAAAPALLRAGMTEVELAGLIEAVARREGHSGILRMRYFNQENFYGHVLSGANGAVPSFLDSPSGGQGLGAAMPQGAGLKTILPGEPIFVDLVAVHGGMMVDQTRIFALDSLPDDLAAAHRAMLTVQQVIVSAMIPGAIAGDLYELAVRAASDMGQAANFMGSGQDRVSFVGHGVGLELNELPIIARGVRTPLAAGNVIAIEPKCFFPGRGAVGIENTWLVTETGPERLTTTPDDILIV